MTQAFVCSFVPCLHLHPGFVQARHTLPMSHVPVSGLFHVLLYSQEEMKQSKASFLGCQQLVICCWNSVVPLNRPGACDWEPPVSRKVKGKNTSLFLPLILKIHNIMKGLFLLLLSLCHRQSLSNFSSVHNAPLEWLILRTTGSHPGDYVQMTFITIKGEL